MSGVIESLSRPGIVPVVTIDDAAAAADLADALAAGGLRCAEITLRTASGLDAIRAVAGRDDFLVGAGTVLSTDDVDRAVDAGARFLVSPGYDDEVVERAMARSVTIVPGIATATELQRAMRAGLGAVKVFPAEHLGGPGVLRALSAPFPAVRFMPSGGIRRDNMLDYLDVPTAFAVGGSWMVPREEVSRRDIDTIRALTADAVALIEAHRAEPSAP